MSNYMDHINFVPKSELKVALNIFKQRNEIRTRKMFEFKHPQGYVIASQKAFYDAAIFSFPLDPPISQNNYNIGGLIDSLHGGLRSVEEQIIDIVWLGVDIVAKESIPSLIRAVDLLDSALFGFRDVNFDRNPYTRLLLVYKDNAPGFSSGFW